MPDCITTYTGIHFDPLAPTPEGLEIRDIAHALSLLCRGNGHVQTFFSVGQHCIHCALEAQARGMSRRVVLACLLHDASEAYLSDVPRPFKKSLPAYQQLENRLLAVIYQTYLGSELTDEEAAQVKQIDDDMLWYDLTTLLRDPPARPAPAMSTAFSYEVRPFAQVEQHYLALYEQFRLQ